MQPPETHNAGGVLLVRPSDGVRAEDRTYDHIGVGYLKAYLDFHGADVHVSDMVLGRETTAEHVVRRVRETRPALVGISATSQTGFHQTLDVARAIKKSDAAVPICIGGHFPTAAHQELLRDFDCFDYAVRGEGEEPLLQLARRAAAGCDASGVAGVTHRQGCEIIVEPAAPLIQDLDTLPFPNRDFLPPEYGGIRYATITSSRGCPYRCSFCSIHAFYGCSWRPRSAENVVAEMVELHERRGCNGFDFADDTFIPPGAPGVERVTQFCDVLRKSGLQDITLIALMTAGCVKEEIIRNLRSVGLRSVLVGIESASPAVLRRFHKGATVALNDSALEVLVKYGLEVNAGFIMFDPDTTLQDIRLNIAFLKRHVSYLIFELLTKITVYTGTPIYEDLRSRGRLKGDYLQPAYDFADPKVDWLYWVSSTLMERWMGVVSDWTRGFKWGAHLLPAAVRRQRRQEMFAFALDVFSNLTDFVERQARLPEVDETVERLAPGVSKGFEELIRPISEADLEEIRQDISRHMGRAAQRC